MKRSALKRGSSRLKRKPLRRVGARAEREREALDEFRRVVLARGRCEYPGCGGTKYLEAHHIRRRMGAKTHTGENGMCCCREHHDAIERHLVPDWRDFKKGERDA